jgi:SWI/SNF-related matrix-associated actin-dependent regulator 1 of chromatin subfamily A
VKNVKAQRTSAAAEVVRRAKYKILLTGTPAVNHGWEYWTQLHFCGLDMSYTAFRDSFCLWYDVDIKRNGKKQTVRNYFSFENEKALEEVVRFYCICRKKKDVLSDLPNKIRSMIYLDATDDVKKLSDVILNQIEQINEKKELVRSMDSGEADKEKILNELKAMSNFVISEIEEFRKHAFECKKEKVVEFVNNLVDNKIKTVVFCYHKEAASYLYSMINGKDYLNKVMITGDLDVDRRQELVMRFQNDRDCRVAVCTLRAAAVGITLTQASNVVFAEFDWNPAILLQAEDRVHRVTQDKDVNIYYFVLAGTIDENFIVNLLNKVEKGLNCEFSFDYFIRPVEGGNGKKHGNW